MLSIYIRSTYINLHATTPKLINPLSSCTSICVAAVSKITLTNFMQPEKEREKDPSVPSLVEGTSESKEVMWLWETRLHCFSCSGDHVLNVSGGIKTLRYLLSYYEWHGGLAIDMLRFPGFSPYHTGSMSMFCKWTKRTRKGVCHP